MSTLIVIAKACLPGRVKTRLSPPFSPQQAAELASASLADTLAAVGGIRVDRRILYFDGDHRHVPAEGRGWEVLPQAPGGLDTRLAAVFDLCDGPTALIGMDTPQVTAELLAPLLDPRSTADSWLGLATDGGFWALGMREPDGSLIRGVPMSTEETGREQLIRLRRSGRSVRLLEELTDIDRAADLWQVAEAVPDSRVARVLARLAATDARLTRSALVDA
ncbi:MAG: glycosyltransferase [Naasia sp.]|uniref:TIGR04282 family arsenosugar biosynthesis glycosyltransferase n=1 Tax=Naasia sp. TaxID=2546198 RepID=UPI0026393453|nr:DUF2064 domain-containing protein [Naasia sp.]MCU1569461.1 glycosyltransferase [Naasia sp.]